MRTSAAGPAPAGSSAGGAARPSSRSRCRRWSSVQGQRSSTLRAHARSPRHVRLKFSSGVPFDLRVPTLASSPSTLEPAVVQVRQLAKPTLQQAVLQLRMTYEISPHTGSVKGHHLHKHPAALPPACWSSGVQRASWRTSSCQAKLHAGGRDRPVLEQQGVDVVVRRPLAQRLAAPRLHRAHRRRVARLHLQLRRSGQRGFQLR